jgi:uncharacterized protein (DUF433 family)
MGHQHEELLNRIVIDPDIMVGKPVIRGTRLTVQFILELMSDGLSIEEIIDEYQGLKREDIIACLCYASESIQHTSVVPLKIEA